MGNSNHWKVRPQVKVNRIGENRVFLVYVSDSGLEMQQKEKWKQDLPASMGFFPPLLSSVPLVSVDSDEQAWVGKGDCVRGEWVCLMHL